MATRRVTPPPRPSFGRPTSRSSSAGRPAANWVWRQWRLILLVIFVWLVWSYFGIRSITISGAKAIDQTKLSAEASLLLHHRPWGNNLLTMNDTKLVGDLQQQEYRLKSVRVIRHFPHRLELAVVERQPSLNWQTGAQVYVLDIDGSLIGPASGQSVSLPTVVDSTNLPVKVGDKVVPPHFVKFCSDLIQLLPQRTGINIAGLRVPDTTSEVYVSTNKGYMIKFDTTREASGEVDDLVNVLATLTKIKKTPAEYIDLRVENKAYYR